MKKMHDIPVPKAMQLINDLSLTAGDSFSNPEPSRLCHEYRMETGYYLKQGKERLVKITTTKDENDKEVTKARLELSLEALGVDPEERTDEQDQEVQKTLNKVCLIIEQDPISLGDVKPY